MIAFTKSDNEASKRVLDKLGFVSCGFDDSDNITKYMLNIVDNALSQV